MKYQSILLNKKTLLYISASDLPSRSANSVHVMKMCEAFALTFDEVVLFARGNALKKHDIYKYYGVENIFSLKLFRREKLPVLRAWFYIRDVLKALKNWDNNTVIYTRYLFILPFLIRKYKIVYEGHDMPTNFLRFYILNRVIKSKNIKHVVLISDKLRKLYIQSFPSLKPSKIIVAHDGANELMDKAINQQLADLVIKDKKPKIGYVGSLYEGRGIEIIMNAAKVLQHFSFYIIGGSAEDINYWKSKAMCHNIHFLGHIPHADTGSLLRLFDVLLAPYQSRVLLGKGNADTAAYMSPLKIFEYMAAKKPIICSDLPVLHEVITDGAEGLMIDPSKTDDWINKIQDLINNPVFAQQLANNAYRKFISNYTWGKRAQNITMFISKNEFKNDA
jgi:glycosyltransferase involved in cell wall biosynthesis